MDKVIFPIDKGQRYYKIHYQYLLDIFKYNKVNIELSSNDELDSVRFTINVDGKEVLVDFSDHTELYPKHKDYEYYFKFHWTEGLHERYSNVYPLGPVSFYDWQQYYQLLDEIKYKHGRLILNNQVPYAGALERRTKVQLMLKKQWEYRDNIEFRKIKQIDFWKRINICLVSVCVPGARNDMLDRGQVQYMAFGACTISPYLKTILPYYQKLIPNRDYIKCEDDYSDLIERIEWARNNYEECILMGQRAKNKFLSYCSPTEIRRWIDKTINP